MIFLKSQTNIPVNYCVWLFLHEYRLNFFKFIMISVGLF
jgi:hypothetical protein